MADISSQIDTIRRSDRGENVRDAITSALQAINNDTPYPDPESLVIQMQTGSDYHQTGGPWDEVTVLQPGSGGKTTELKELIVSDNNTEWPRDEDNYDPDKQQIYYSKVKVKVNQLANDVLMEPVTITQNGEYSATEWGVDGLRNIIVDIQGAAGDGPFTVNFYDNTKTTIVKTELVPKGGKASCTVYDGMTINGEYFKGWNPIPSNVTRDMDCYPIFGDVVIGPGEIEDDWPIICEKRGAGYPLGAHRSLVVNVPARPEAGELIWHTTNDGIWSTNGKTTHPSIPIAMDMYKVAEGEDGTTSTWLSTGVLPIYPQWSGGHPDYSGNVGIYKMAGIKPLEGQSGVWDCVVVDWADSAQREYLNNFLIENIPECLGATIKPVSKQYASFNREPIKGDGVGYERGDIKVYKTSIDKIWVPSLKELHSYFALLPSWSTYSDCEEPSGVDYSAVYMPTYPEKFFLRSSYIGPNFINTFTKSGGDIGVITAGTPGCPFGFCL